MAEISATREMRARRGRAGYLKGASAEEAVARDYARRGYQLAESCFRGPGGEIDLIFRNGTGLVFVEVKASATHAQAAERVSERQAARIQASASSYLERMPCGQLTDIRFDVALVDGSGRIACLENAFM